MNGKAEWWENHRGSSLEMDKLAPLGDPECDDDSCEKRSGTCGGRNAIVADTKAL